MRSRQFSISNNWEDTSTAAAAEFGTLLLREGAGRGEGGQPGIVWF